jgi:hypothetical protein
VIVLATCRLFALRQARVKLVAPVMIVSRRPFGTAASAAMPPPVRRQLVAPVTSQASVVLPAAVVGEAWNRRMLS